MSHALQTVIVGGGMITYDQILPSIYHLQRAGSIDQITVCALNAVPARSKTLNKDMGYSPLMAVSRLLTLPFRNLRLVRYWIEFSVNLACST